MNNIVRSVILAITALLLSSCAVEFAGWATAGRPGVLSVPSPTRSSGGTTEANGAGHNNTASLSMGVFRNTGHNSPHLGRWHSRTKPGCHRKTTTPGAAPRPPQCLPRVTPGRHHRSELDSHGGTRPDLHDWLRGSFFYFTTPTYTFRYLRIAKKLDTAPKNDPATTNPSISNAKLC